MSEEEAYGISIAGLDYVENTLGNDDPKSFFQQMCFEREELARKLEYWCGYINSKNKDVGVRDITYDLLKRVLDKFVEFDPEDLPILEEGFEEHCFCNRGIRITPNETKYCPVHGYDFSEQTTTKEEEE